MGDREDALRELAKVGRAIPPAKERLEALYQRRGELLVALRDGDDPVPFPQLAEALGIRENLAVYAYRQASGVPRPPRKKAG